MPCRCGPVRFPNSLFGTFKLVGEPDYVGVGMREGGRVARWRRKEEKYKLRICTSTARQLRACLQNGQYARKATHMLLRKLGCD